MLKRISLILLVALALNVGSAWAWAVWGGPASYDPLRSAELRRQQWNRNADAASDDVWIHQVWHRRGLEVVLWWPDREPSRRRYDFHAGWPWPSLEGRIILPEPDAKPDANWSIPIAHETELEVVTIKLTSSTTIPTVLPLKPRWPGLIASVLVVGGALGAVWLIAWAGRAFVRVLSGRCPACGYWVGDQKPRGCPECGWRRDTAGHFGAPAS